MDRLNIRTKNRKFETAKDLYGIFFEDINRAGDGGIYPEMIRNRCFEDSLLPEGYTQRADGVHVVTDSGWEDEFNGGEGLSSWVEEDQIEKTSVPGWYAQDARMRLEQADTLNKNRKAALNVRFEKGGSIWNIGFCGIPQKKGEAYKFCLFAKTAQETKLEVSVIENNVCFASTTLLLKGNGYVKYDAVLAATGDSQNAKLIFRCPDGGEILFGFTSLMPGTTYNGHGLRVDLVEKLRDLHPSFMRFPGGCIVEGSTPSTVMLFRNTVGPVWTDGLHHEFEILEDCYRKSLQKALELKCESIAFPLISTGVYGFPKDKVLQIAVSVFSQFLTENEIEIILVVFDKRSFQLSVQIVGDIDSYIDANYVKESHRKEYPVRSRSGTRRRELSEEAFYEEMLQREAEDNYPLEEDAGLAQPCMLSADISLEDQLSNIGVSFHDKLFELIDEAHIDNKDVWKRANLDRKHFSKIQCDQNYHPKKKTVMALCIALKLDLEQSKDLLARADWAFSPSSKVDLIVQKAIIDKQYDIMQLNVTLFKYTNEILGV